MSAYERKLTQCLYEVIAHTTVYDIRIYRVARKQLYWMFITILADIRELIAYHRTLLFFVRKSQKLILNAKIRNY